MKTLQFPVQRVEADYDGRYCYTVLVDYGFYAVTQGPACMVDEGRYSPPGTMLDGRLKAKKLLFVVDNELLWLPASCLIDLQPRHKGVPLPSETYTRLGKVLKAA